MDEQQPYQPYAPQTPQPAPQAPQAPQYAQQAPQAPQAPQPAPQAPQYAPQAPAYAPQAQTYIQPPKPKKGWGKLLAALACLPLLIVAEVVGLYAGDLIPLGEDVTATLAGAVAAIVLCCLLGGSQLFNITGSSWKWAWHAMWWSIAISGAIALLDLYDYISTDSLDIVGDWPWQLFLSLIFCLAIGFFEEGMCRGLVLNGLLSRMGTSRKGIVWACVISSIFFGILHVDITRIGDVTALEFAQGVLKVVQTGMYGFALAAVVVKTGELVSVAFLHCLDDWLLFILTFVMGESLETEYVSSGTEEGIATVIVYVVCIALYIPLVVRAAHSLKTCDVPNRGAFFREKTNAFAPQPAAVPAYGYAQQPAAAPVQQAYGYAQQPAVPAYQPPVAPVYQPPAAPAYPQQPAAPVQAPTYAQQAPQPVSPAAPPPPANLIPTEIPESSLYRMERIDPQSGQTPPDQQTSR